MIANPLVSPYFLPLVRVIVGILGSTLLVLLGVVRLDVARLRRSVLFQRWATWAIIAPIYSLAVLSGDLTTLLLLTLLVFQGLREYSRLVALPRSYRLVLLGLGFLAVPSAHLSLNAFLFLPPALLMGATLQLLVLHEEGGNVRHLAFACLGWGYIGWFLAHLMALYKYVEGGQGILLSIGLAVALSDVGAFVVGRLFGRRRMAPRISPNKTWEGVAGNLVGAYLGTFLTSFALPESVLPALVVSLPIVVALGAVWGDLVESALKREFQAKDAGTWLPGFGGLLDRIDSLLIVGPLVFYFLRFLGAFT